MREGYKAWNSGEIEPIIELLSPDVEWITSASFPGLKERYHGHDGFRKFWDDLRGPWEDIHVEIEGVEREENYGILRIRFHGTSKSSGVGVDLPWFQAVVMDDDKITHSALSRSIGDALEAVGGEDHWREF